MFMPKAACDLDDVLADAAQTDHAERLAVQFDADETLFVPLAVLQFGVRLRHVAGHADQEQRSCVRRS